MTLSKYKAFMAYIEPRDLVRLKRFARTKKTTMAGLIREAVVARLAGGDPYNSGFNAGLRKAAEVAKETKGAQMRFPSGKTFGELVTDELENHFVVEASDAA